MVSRRSVAFKALLPTLVALLSLCNGEQYKLKSELTKETWAKIQQLGDISGDSAAVLQQYTGVIADYCRQQLEQQNYRAELDEKLDYYKGKLEYDDKLLHSDELHCENDEACKKECRTKCENNMDATITNANVYLPGLKKEAVKKIKDFMDSCTQLSINEIDQSKLVAKRSDTKKKEISEPSDQYHW